MEFREYIESEEARMSEGGVWPRVRMGLAAGALGAAALTPFALPVKDSPGVGVSRRYISPDDPDSVELRERSKDRNRYYNPVTMRKIVSLALKGDEWAVREVAWPEGHPLHAKGRPFFTNGDRPHPDGLFGGR